jgi:hypothetical protein
VKRLLWEVSDMLNDKFYHRYYNGYVEKMLTKYDVRDTVYVLQESVEFIIRDLIINKESSYGGFIEI